jgi:cysteine-rich repeat protein
VALVTSARPSGATVAANLPCKEGQAGPTCTLDTKSDITVDPNSIIDFGSRDLIIRRQTTLRVGPTVTLPVTITAKSITLDAGAGIVDNGGDLTVKATTGDIRIGAASGTSARIDVSANPSGGLVTLNALTGGVDIAGILTAKAATAGDGGNITVKAATRITVSGEVDATGRTGGGGGFVELDTTTGPITVDGPIDVSGTDAGGGEIDLNGFSVTTSVKMDASGGGSAGDGGTISISTTTGPVIMLAGADLRGAPAGTSVMGGGGGGEIDIDAGQDIDIEDDLILNGGSPGDGGVASLAATGNLTLAANIFAAGNGADSVGSDGIELMAGRDINLANVNATIDVSASGVGGNVSISAAGKTTIGAQFTINADGTGPSGLGGEIDVPDVIPGENIQIDGDISADGIQMGGMLTIEACDTLTISATGSLSARGEDGSTSLAARSLLRVAGSVVSGLGGGVHGENDIEYRSTPPDISGATIIPLASQTAGLPACDLCGNGILDTAVGEVCDDGNRVDGDGCDSNCKPTGCGNGIVTAGEGCDDGNHVDCDGCRADCSRPDNICGDGHLDADCGEVCDDGNREGCDGCTADCSRIDNFCGDHIAECGEECDSDTVNGGLHCDQSCTLQPPPHCGDGMLQANEGEQCDPPVVGSCSHLCQNEICGDGIKDEDEACDDGNTNPCDGCAADCKHTDHTCGDGNVDCGEQCDDGVNDGTTCDSNCTFPACGNGILDPDEACDDGNTNSCDGCRSDCSRFDAVCGDHIVECGEDCDPTGPGCDDHCHETSGCTVDADCGGLCVAKCVAGVCNVGQRLTCDDGNACTSDSCVNDACQHTAAADGTPCDHSDACTTKACQAGQCASTELSCDDGDFCTDDSCAPDTGCAHTQLTGISAVTCQLDAIDDALSRGAALLKGPARQKISNAVRKARTTLRAANAVAGTPKATKKLKAAKMALKALAKTVKMARKKKQLTEPLGGLVDGYTSGALGALSSVQI